MSRDSIVNELTGEVMVPTDYLRSLHAYERTIFRFDNAIAALKGDLKEAKIGREKAIGQLRTAIREAKLVAEKATRAVAKEPKP